MIHLRLYGQPNSKYEYIKKSIKDKARGSDTPLKIEEICDVESFIEDNIHTIPTVVINDQTRIEYRTHEDMEAFLNELSQLMAAEDSYDHLLKCIVPVDFSLGSLKAARFALKYAKRMKAAVKIMHCYSPSRAILDGPIPQQVDLEETHRKRFDSFYERLVSSNEDADILIKKDFRIGDTVNEIMASAGEEGKSMVIMASHGDRPMIEKIFGSVTLRTLLKSEKPVLIVPPNIEFDDINIMAYAYDSIDFEDPGLDFMAWQAIVFGAYLYLVHVRDSKEASHSVNLESLEQKYPELNVFHHEIEGNDVVKSLQDYTTENQIELLAVSKKKKNLINKLFGKSVSEELAIHTQIPLMVMQYGQQFDERSNNVK